MPLIEKALLLLNAVKEGLPTIQDVHPFPERRSTTCETVQSTAHTINGKRLNQGLTPPSPQICTKGQQKEFLQTDSSGSGRKSALISGFSFQIKAHQSKTMGVATVSITKLWPALTALGTFTVLMFSALKPQPILTQTDYSKLDLTLVSEMFPMILLSTALFLVVRNH